VDDYGAALRVALADVDIKSAAFTAGGNTLALGLADGRVRVVAWPSLKMKFTTLDAHADAVTGLAFSPDGRFILTTSAEAANARGEDGNGKGGAAVWSTQSGERVRALRWTRAPNARRCAFRFAGFGPEGTNVAYTGLNVDAEGHVVIWDTDTWTIRATRRVCRDPISAMALSPDGASVAVGTSEGHLHLASAETLRVTKTDKSSHMIFVTTMAFNTDGTCVLSGSADASACVTRVGRRGGVLGGICFYFFLLALLGAWTYGYVKHAFVREYTAVAAKNGAIAMKFGARAAYAAGSKAVAAAIAAREAGLAREAKKRAERAAAGDAGGDDAGDDLDDLERDYKYRYTPEDGSAAMPPKPPEGLSPGDFDGGAGVGDGDFEVRSIHWSPYDRVGDVNADP
jgi:hypothetical protein